MRLTTQTETLRNWLAITETEIAQLKDSQVQQAEAKLAHANKTRDIIAGELKLRDAEVHDQAA